MKRIILFIFLSSLFLIPKDHRLISVDDDDDYLAVATAIAYAQFPSFRDEYHVGQTMPFASVGPGVLASPFVALFSVLDRWQDAPIVSKRTQENRYWTWTLVGFHVATYFYLLMGMILIYLILCHFVSEPNAFLSTIALICSGGGILIYTFRRPVMSHVYEVFTISLSLFLMTKIKARKISPSTFDLIIGISSSFIFLVRYNNIFLALCFILIYLYLVESPYFTLSFWKRIARLCLGFITPIIIFRLLPVLVNGYSSSDQGYQGVWQRLIPSTEVSFYFKRLNVILFGIDMGLIYTAPIFFLAIGGLFIQFKKETKIFMPLALCLLVNLYLTFVWKSFGSYYGYRYLVFTAIPVLSIAIAYSIERLTARVGRPIGIALILLLSIVPLSSILLFERTEEFSYRLVTNEFNILTWSQPTYHKEVIKLLINDPTKVIKLGWEQGAKAFYSVKSFSNNDYQRAMFLFFPPLLMLTLIYLVNRCKNKKQILTMKYKIV